MHIPVEEFSAKILQHNSRQHICVIDTSILDYDANELQWFFAIHESVVPTQILAEIKHSSRRQVAEQYRADIATDLDLLKGALLLMGGPKATAHRRITPLLEAAIYGELTEEDFNGADFAEARHYLALIASNQPTWYEKVQTTKAYLDKRYAVSKGDIGVVATALRLAEEGKRAVVCTNDKDIGFAVRKAEQFGAYIWCARTLRNH